MSTRNRFKRILSVIMAIAMVMTFVPFSAAAADSGTVKGDKAVVAIGNDEITGRDNTFNKDWKFYLGDNSSAQNKNFDDSSWDDVNLPHDFSIIQNFTSSGEAESGFLPGGTGWYRKTFTMPEETAGKTILLNFDGVYSDAYVYVNGVSVGEHHYGYTSFAIDITEHLVCDNATENVIAVKAVNNIPTSRWYSGSGIYRDVTLVVTDPVHVDLNGTYVTTPNIADKNGTVVVENTIVNDGSASVKATVKTTVYKDGASVATGSSFDDIEAGSSAVITTSQVVASPALWSIETPNLYTLVTEVSVDGEVVDTTETTFGFRWFTFNSQGFQLNGNNVKLNGVCLHHDQGALGSAAYYDAMYRQLSIMKDMGANAIRTSHNPADQQFIEICNELGLLVIEEVFDGITASKNDNYNDFAKNFKEAVDTRLYGAADGMICSEYATRSIVKRDRNAPSVFAWSYGNEIQEGAWSDPQFVTYCEKFIQWTNDEDGSRIVTIGDNTKSLKASGSVLSQVLTKIVEAGGVAGFNYHCHQINSEYLLADYGGQHGSIIASETSSHVNSRGFYKNQASASTSYGYHLTSYDTSAVGWGDTAHDSMYDTLTKDYIAGEFVWTGFDYIGEPTPWNGTSSGDGGRGAIPNSSYFGIVETTGFPKDSYYLYRSQWNKAKTTVHLVTAWDSDNMMTSSGKTPVWLYSNAPKVELYLNGDLIGTATRTPHTSAAGHTYYTYSSVSNNTSVCSVTNGSGADALYAVFNVAYTAGTLSTKAYDESGNQITLDASCGQHTVSTPGAVSKLVISKDKTTVEADGSSLVYITVDVTDANGNLDTTASNNITFTVSDHGEIAGVDNGDQATVDKFQQASVLTSATTANIDAYAGKALVIVRTTEDHGEITVNIASDGLTGGTVIINATPVSGSSDNGLVSLTMVKDYSVKAGTAPALDTAVTGTLADDSTVNGTIAWETVSADVYGTAGDYTVSGTASFSGYDAIPVTARLHVIPNVIAMRNIATAATANVVPALPSTVNGVLADGTLAGEFTVKWDSVDSADLATVGKTLIVNGTATVMGEETLPVTCAIRVAQAVQTESENIAPQYLSLTQDIPADMQSDYLPSIADENTNPGEDTNARWTNWGNRYNSDTATITMDWATAHSISEINLYYRYDSSACAHPDSVAFEYSLSGSEYVAIEATESSISDATVSNGAAYNYKLAEVINPVAIRITFTQQGGTSQGKCVGLYEMEVMTYAAAIEYNTSADLSGITVDGTAIEGFAADTLNYEQDGDAVEATTAENAGITVLPEYKGIVRILTISEDGSDTKTYSVKVGEAPVDPEPSVPDTTDPTVPDSTEPKPSEPVEEPECPKDETCVLAQFSDIDPDSCWYHDGVHYCVETGLMKGQGNNSFAPDAFTTRAELVMILYRQAGSPSLDGLTEPFTDVADDAWYYAPIVWAYNKGVVNGTSATTFAPDANITRQDVATILYRYLESPDGTGDLSGFSDAANVWDHAKEAMAWAVGEGLITGDAKDGIILLDPTGNATRAQIAAILHRHLTAE